MRQHLLLLALVLAAPTAPRANPVTWSPRTGMPGIADGLAAVDVSGTLFVFGGGTTGDGTTVSATVRAYSRVTNAWTTRTSMPTARAFHAAVAVGSTVYVIGGHVSLDGLGGALGSTTYCHAYNTKTDTWTLISPMAVPREAFGAASAGGKLYVFGGYNTIGGGPLASVESYDPATNAWSPKTAMATSRVQPAAASAPDGNIYVCGGNDGGATTSVLAYNVAGNSFSSRAPLPLARYNSAALLAGPFIFVLGGEVAGTTSAVYAYNFGADAWTTAPPLPSNRAGAAAALHQGAIELVGGHTTFPAAVATLEEGISGMDAAGVAVPGSLGPGQSFEVRLTVTNTGWSQVNTINPFIQITANGGAVSLASGPLPPGPITLPPGIAGTFTWTYNALSAATVNFTASVMGTESQTGSSFWVGATAQVLIAAPPSQPVFVTAIAGNSRVDLSWLPATPGTFAISGYSVYRATISPGTIVKIGTVYGATTVFADTTVTNGLVQFYRVEAFDVSTPPLSGQISADISATPFAPPGAPTGLTLTPQSAKMVVNWLPGTPGSFAAGNFHLFRRTGPGTDFELATPGPTATFYSDNALVNGTIYTYYLQASDVYGHLSATTGEASEAPRSGPFAPTGLSALGLNQRVILNWSAGSAGTFGPLSGYSVYRGPVPGSETFLAGPVYTTTHTDTTAANGASYFYAVRSRDAKGHESASSVGVMATPTVGAVNPPTGVAAVAASTQTQVAWTAPGLGDTSVVGGITQYAILRSTCATCGFSTSVYVAGSATTYQDLNPPGGTAYYYAVRARTVNNYESGDVAGVSITSPVQAVLNLALAVSPGAPAVPNAFTVSVTVTNTGAGDWSSVTPQIWISAGSGAVTPVAGPTPAGGGLVPSPMAQTFVWDYTAAGAGPVVFTVSISAQNTLSGDFIFGLATTTITIAAAAVTSATPAAEPTLQARVESGKSLLGPNVLNRAGGPAVRLALRGNAGGRVTVRFFDDGGREVRSLGVDLDGQGLAVVPLDGADDGGHPLAPGMYHVVSTGGGVKDRRVLAVRGAK